MTERWRCVGGMVREVTKEVNMKGKKVSSSADQVSSQSLKTIE